MNIMFEFKTFGFEIMLNCHLSQKFKLIKRGECNHLINILTLSFDFLCIG
jgi:hypothetical protein